MRKIRELKYWIQGYEAVQAQFGEVETSVEFYREGVIEESEVDAAVAELEAQLSTLEFRNMLSGEEDKMSAVLQVTAGAGGTESCDWAGMLMRMYLRWAERNGHKVRELNFQEGEVAGVKPLPPKSKASLCLATSRARTESTASCASVPLIPTRADTRPS